MNGPRYVSRCTAVAARALGDELMVMSAANSTLFTLDEVARILWEAADGVTPLEEIVATQVCTRYDVRLEAALQDAQSFVEQLAAHGLLICSDALILPVSQPVAKT